jgi:hypothetical protein
MTVSEADKFKVSIAFLTTLLKEVGIFEVAKIVAEQQAHASTTEKRLAKKWCRRLAKYAGRDPHPDIGETREKAAAVQLYAEHLSASHDPHRAFWVAAQCQDIDTPHHHTPLSVGEETGDLFFMDEFVQMVEGGSVRPKDGIIGETYGADSFDWDNPRTQMQRVQNPESVVIRWCNK